MQENEQEWIEGIRTGDEAAFEEMFRAYYPKLCRFAAEYVDSSGRARDLVQDVFLRVWDGRSEWRVDRSLKAYLYQSVRNRALNEVRNRDTRNAAVDDLEYTSSRHRKPSAADAAHGNALSRQVDEAIQSLPRRRRMAFLLHRRHGFTYQEIATVMGITAKTVENQIGRALKSLREELAPVFSHDL